MKRHTAQFAGFVSITLLIVSACPQLFGQRTVVKGIAEAEFFGSITKGSYANAFFGFRFVIPDGFTVLDHKQIEIYSRAGADLLKGGNEEASKKIDKAMLTEASLLGVAQKAPGQPQNAFLEIAVQKQTVGITANIALAASTTLITSTGKARLVKSLGSKFGGRAFAGAQFEFDLPLKLTQEMYVIILYGYSVHFVISYSTTEGRDNMLLMMNSIQFIK